MRKLWKNPITLLCAFCLAESIILRVAGLTRPYDYDEIFTAVTANPALPWSYIFKNYLLVDVHPPLHNFIMWLWNHVFPYGPEWLGRLPNVFFGLAALLIGWKFFPRMEEPKQRQTARWIFILLLAVNHTLIWQTQYLRMYALLLLLAIPFTFLYLKMSRKIQSNIDISAREWTAYGALSLLLCYSHYFGALAFGLSSLVLFGLACIYKREKRWFIWVPFLVFLLFLPWLIPNLLSNTEQVRFNGRWWANDLWHFADGFNIFSMAKYKITEFSGYFFTYPFIKWFIWILCALAMLFNYQNNPKQSCGKEIVLLLIPSLLAFGLTLFTFHKIYLLFFRYFIPFIPAITLAIAFLLAPMLTRFKWIMILIIANAIYSLFGAMNYIKTVNFDLGMSNGRTLAKQIIARNPSTLLVALIEGYPKNAQEELFAYYLHIYFKQSIPIINLYSITSQQRDKLLSEPNTIVYMPLCEDWKVDRLFKDWGWLFMKTKTENGFCLLKPFRIQKWPESESEEVSSYPKGKTDASDVEETQASSL